MARVTQERVIPGVQQDTKARVTQERVIPGVQQDTKARTTQERVSVGVQQDTKARVTQERLIVAVVPAGRVNLAGRMGASAFSVRIATGRASIAI